MKNNPLIMTLKKIEYLTDDCKKRLKLHKYSMAGVDVDGNLAIYCDKENTLLYTETFKDELEFIKFTICGELTLTLD